MSRADMRSELTFAQVHADLIMAERAMEEAERSERHLAKYLRGQAGYHLQQAAEKMIKIQIYRSGKEIDPAKIYKHRLNDLIGYASSLSIEVNVPPYVDNHAIAISAWETDGRYDMHVVVRMDTLRKCYTELLKWYNDLSGESLNHISRKKQPVRSR